MLVKSLWSEIDRVLITTGVWLLHIFMGVGSCLDQIHNLIFLSHFHMFDYKSVMLEIMIRIIFSASVGYQIVASLS